MNHTVFTFAPGQHSNENNRLKPVPEPSNETTALPDREWGLSAPQVAIIVIAIVAISDLIGLLL
jgi:hypothetical protein